MTTAIELLEKAKAVKEQTVADLGKRPSPVVGIVELPRNLKKKKQKKATKKDIGLGPKTRSY